MEFEGSLSESNLETLKEAHEQVDRVYHALVQAIEREGVECDILKELNTTISQIYGAIDGLIIDIESEEKP